MAEAVALISGGLSFFESQQQNRANRVARDQEMASADVAASQRSAITARNLAELSGSIRATAAGRGVAGSQSVFALGQAAQVAGQQERGSIEMTRFMERVGAQSRYAARYTNPLLAGIGSGIGGYFNAGGSEGSIF